jgi:hypothetical protein
MQARLYSGSSRVPIGHGGHAAQIGRVNFNLITAMPSPHLYFGSGQIPIPSSGRPNFGHGHIGHKHATHIGRVNLSLMTAMPSSLLWTFVSAAAAAMPAPVRASNAAAAAGTSRGDARTRRAAQRGSSAEAVWVAGQPLAPSQEARTRRQSAEVAAG